MKERDDEALKTAVKKFWESTPCGTFLSEFEEGTKEYFDDLERLRYSDAHYGYGYWRDMLNPPSWKEKEVLEVGCGVGTDLIQMARAGAKAHGVDLTESAITLAKRRFPLYNLDADVNVGDAENLAFPDNYFDLTYSFGVIHHTPNTQKAVDELYRVTKEGGKVMVMLYHTKSLNMFMFLLRKYKNKELRSVSYNEVVNLLTEVNKNKEGPNNPLTKTYTKSEAKELFKKFKKTKMSIRWLELPYKLTAPHSNILDRFFGWHLVIEAYK